ncbi:MAG: transcription termination/antitermination NusG family protein [Bacillota bacterium]
MILNWYVLYTKSHKEISVINQLRFKKIKFYFPQIRVNTENHKSCKTTPFFPRYIFVNVDHNMIIDPKIKWMPGVVNVVSFDNQPAIVSDEIIHQLQKRIDENYLTKNKKKSEYQKGDHIAIVEGPFAGYSGIFDTNLLGSSRAKILVKLINDQSKKIVVPYEQIAK